MSEKIDSKDESAFAAHMRETLRAFFSRVDGLSRDLPMLIHVAMNLFTHVDKRFDEFLKLHCIPPSEADTPVEGYNEVRVTEVDDEGKSDVVYSIPRDKARTFRFFREEIERLGIVCKTMPELTLVALVSQFDVHLAGLIRGMLMAKPELLQASERTITYSELLAFSSFEEAKEYFTEKTVEGVLRGNHSEQFSWLENKLGFSLRKGLDVWPKFVEITQRRNLFVHTDGVVTAHYIDECRKVAFPHDGEIRRGMQLHVSPEYIASVKDVFLEIGIKLGYVIWKALGSAPDSEEADYYLNNVSVDLIGRRNFELARKLLEFPQPKTQPKISNSMAQMYIDINRALVYKKMGKGQRVRDIVDGIEWRMLSDEFQLAKLVLQESFDAAADLMRKIGLNGDVVSETNYLEWPLLDEFRKTEFFARAFRDVFGRDFVEYTVVDIRKFVYGSAADGTAGSNDAEGDDSSAALEGEEHALPED